MTFNTIRLSVLLTLALVGLSACHSSTAHRVPITGQTASSGQAIAVEVTNPAGGVVVVADSSLKTPVVQARTRGRSNASDRVSATLSGSSLSVGRTEGGLSGDLVDITVWVPQSRGVAIINSQGSVRLTRVGGPIHVESGTDLESGGPIELRTDVPLTQGLHLATTNGAIKAIIPGQSAGRIELSAPAHRAFIRSGEGELHENRTAPGQHTAILNSGAAEINLLSGYGDVELDIIHAPFESGAWPRH